MPFTAELDTLALFLWQRVNCGRSRYKTSGAFGGVFTPCTLTVLGVMIFLRFGHAVGQAGLTHSLAAVLASKAAK